LQWVGNALWFLWHHSCHHAYWQQLATQSTGNRGKKIAATVDVVIPSGSTLTNCHDQICVGDGSDKWVADYVNICIPVSKNVSVIDFSIVCPFNLCLHNCLYNHLHTCLGTLFT